MKSELIVSLCLLLVATSHSSTVEYVQKALLETLHMDKVPNGQKLRSKHEIPEFITELHDQQKNLDTSTFFLPGALTGSADKLTSLKGKVVTHANGLRKNEVIVDFDGFGGIPEGEQLEAAFLKVYWKPNIAKKRKRGTFRMRVFDVIRYKTEPDLRITSLHDVKKINHRDAELDEGWYEFEVVGAVVRWAQKRPNKTRLLLDIGSIKIKDMPGYKLVPEGKITEAHLLIFTEGTDSKPSRKKRSPTPAKKNKWRQQRRKKNRHNPCQRQSMYVDFAKVGWNDWIVAPPGYDAFLCNGECRFPLADHLNGTNHAIVQTLVNGVNPSAVPQPCCVPTETSPISMLYLDEYGKVLLKNYADMVAEACGCR